MIAALPTAKSTGQRVCTSMFPNPRASDSIASRYWFQRLRCARRLGPGELQLALAKIAVQGDSDAFIIHLLISQQGTAS